MCVFCPSSVWDLNISGVMGLNMYDSFGWYKYIMLIDFIEQLCVDILKLQKVVLLGYLPDNLALLMDTLQGSSISFLGKQIYSFLHRVEWEVRDTTLELLQALCALSEHSMFFIFVFIVITMQECRFKPLGHKCRSLGSIGYLYERITSTNSPCTQELTCCQFGFSRY